MMIENSPQPEGLDPEQNQLSPELGAESLGLLSFDYESAKELPASATILEKSQALDKTPLLERYWRVTDKVTREDLPQKVLRRLASGNELIQVLENFYEKVNQEALKGPDKKISGDQVNQLIADFLDRTIEEAGLEGVWRERPVDYSGLASRYQKVVAGGATETETRQMVHDNFNNIWSAKDAEQRLMVITRVMERVNDRQGWGETEADAEQRHYQATEKFLKALSYEAVKFYSIEIPEAEELDLPPASPRRFEKDEISSQPPQEPKRGIDDLIEMAKPIRRTVGRAAKSLRGLVESGPDRFKTKGEDVEPSDEPKMTKPELQAMFDEAVKTFTLEELGQIRGRLDKIYDRFYRPRKELLNPVGKTEHTEFLLRYDRTLLNRAFENDFRQAVISTAREMEASEMEWTKTEGDKKVKIKEITATDKKPELTSLHLDELERRLKAREAIYQLSVESIISGEKDFHALMTKRKEMLEGQPEPHREWWQILQPRSELDKRWKAVAKFVQQTYFGEKSSGKGKEMSKLPTEADLMTIKQELDKLITTEERLAQHVDNQIVELTDFLLGNRAYVGGSTLEKPKIQEELAKFRNGEIGWQIVLEKLVLDETQNPHIPPSVRRDVKQRLLAIEQWIKSTPPTDHAERKQAA